MPTRKDLPTAELLISEVLQKVSNAKTKKEKIALLQKFNTQALRSVLIWNFDDSVASAIPAGEVPFTPNDAPKGTEHNRLIKEYRKLFRFVKGGDNSLKQMKREQLFIQMLEGLHQEEADLICMVKDKSLQDKYRVTKSVVEEAFPQINWGGRS
jgi:hypothetical protein